MCSKGEIDPKNYELFCHNEHIAWVRVEACVRSSSQAAATSGSILVADDRADMFVRPPRHVSHGKIKIPGKLLYDAGTGD